MRNLRKWHGLGLENVQAGILKGYNRKNIHCIFLSFDKKTSDGIGLMSDIIAQIGISSAEDQVKEAVQIKTYKTGKKQPLISLFLSKAGCDFLDFKPWEKEPGKKNENQPDRLFEKGMNSETSRNLLNDSDVHFWEGKTIHAMVLVADDNANLVNALVEKIKGYIKKRGSEFHIEVGERLIRNQLSYEHFGFRDGLTQIHFFDRSYQLIPGLLELVFPKDSEGNLILGSYLVFRKLKQDVERFRKNLQSIVQKTGEKESQVLGKLMGRLPSGELTIREKDGSSIFKYAYFDYETDQEGTKCPFFSHIRKANPRESGTGFHSQIIRRSIPYGTVHRNEDLNLTGIPEGEVGLLFMCFQASIEKQFAHIQRNFLNTPYRPGSKTAVGIDPIAGQPGPGTGKIDLPEWTFLNGEKTTIQQLDKVVEFKGGEYFFAPPIDKLVEKINELNPIERGHPAKQIENNKKLAKLTVYEKKKTVSYHITKKIKGRRYRY